MHIFDHSFFAMAPVILPHTLHFSNSFLRGSCTIICRSEGMCSHLPLAAVTAVTVAARSVAVSSLRIAIYPAPTWHVAHSVFNIHITYVVLPFFYQTLWNPGFTLRRAKRQQVPLLLFCLLLPASSAAVIISTPLLCLACVNMLLQLRHWFFQKLHTKPLLCLFRIKCSSWWTNNNEL